MKREGFWRDVTPPLNIYGVPLPFTMIYLLLFPYPSKNDILGVQRHSAVFFVLPGIFRLDSPHPLYTSVQPASG